MAQTAERPLALISVSDKTGIGDFARVIHEAGYGVVSTGGTAATLTDGGIPVIPIEEVTGNPELFDGRMKTISFSVESGILFDRFNPQHVEQASQQGIRPIDIVVCNLYPFEQTIEKPGVTFEIANENIDIGGPTMIRAAAKNYKSVLVVVDAADYQRVGEELRRGPIPPEARLRRELAAKVFLRTANYEGAISEYMNEQLKKLDSE